jgi:RNA polymerase sigma factor (sigma-70 family)
MTGKEWVAVESVAEQTGRGEQTRILTPAEEYELVHELCVIRRRIDKKVRPVVEAKAQPEDRTEHFDQIMALFWDAKGIPGSTRRWVHRQMKEYASLKHRLVVCNLAWVTKLARGQRSSMIPEEDLFQEGVCGLLKAIDRFEASRGLRLMTYATWYIREAMQQIRARQSHLVSLSAHDQTLLGQLESLRTEYQHLHSKLPTPMELSQKTMRPARVISRLQLASSAAVSIDRVGDEGSLPIAVADPTEEIDRLDSVKGTVERLLGNLTSRERLVVTRRFGLDGSAPTSLEALGAAMRVSKERVRQLQRQALKRMQQIARQREIEPMPA